jgi:hypothetical protein
MLQQHGYVIEFLMKASAPEVCVPSSEQLFFPLHLHHNKHMTQPRRTSSTRQQIAPKGLVELNESLKNIQQSYANPANPVKPRRPPATRTNDAITTGKPHPKDIFTKRDKPSDPVDLPKRSKKVVTPERMTRRMVSEKVVPGLGVQMVISLPFALASNNEPDLKDMAASETLDNLESTTKGDLHFPLSPECTISSREY